MSDIKQQLDRFLGAKPMMGTGVFISRTAVVIGAVFLGDFSSVWPNAVLRADLNQIRVGRRTNIQDNAVLHLADDLPCILGDEVTVGHGAIVHACTVKDQVLVGMGATILDGAVIGEQSLIGARALVKEGAVIPPGSLVLGIPGRVVRVLTMQERDGLKQLAAKYVEMAACYISTGREF
jgi:gamma-carbonic anhydrase